MFDFDLSNYDDEVNNSSYFLGYITGLYNEDFYRYIRAANDTDEFQAGYRDGCGDRKLYTSWYKPGDKIEPKRIEDWASFNKTLPDGFIVTTVSHIFDPMCVIADGNQVQIQPSKEGWQALPELHMALPDDE